MQRGTNRTQVVKKKNHVFTLKKISEKTLNPTLKKITFALGEGHTTSSL